MSEMKSGSNLEKVLRAGHFAFTGELGPPRGTTAEEVREKCEHLKGMVDAVNITDNQTAVVRMASWAACLILIHFPTTSRRFKKTRGSLQKVSLKDLPPLNMRDDASKAKMLVGSEQTSFFLIVDTILF